MMQQPTRVLTRDEQTDITRVLVKTAQMLASCGAESRIIEQTTCRLGHSLGIESVEMAITPSAVILTTLNHGACITTTRRIHEFGINMQVLCEIQRICILAEKKLLENCERARRIARFPIVSINTFGVLPLFSVAKRSVLNGSAKRRIASGFSAVLSPVPHPHE